MAQCPACERSNAPEDRYCRSCGTPLVMRCAACDTINYEIVTRMGGRFKRSYLGEIA